MLLWVWDDFCSKTIPKNPEAQNNWYLVGYASFAGLTSKYQKNEPREFLRGYLIFNTSRLMKNGSEICWGEKTSIRKKVGLLKHAIVQSHLTTSLDYFPWLQFSFNLGLSWWTSVQACATNRPWTLAISEPSSEISFCAKSVQICDIMCAKSFKYTQKIWPKVLYVLKLGLSLSFCLVYVRKASQKPSEKSSSVRTLATARAHKKICVRKNRLKVTFPIVCAKIALTLFFLFFACAKIAFPMRAQFFCAIW